MPFLSFPPFLLPLSSSLPLLSTSPSSSPSRSLTHPPSSRSPSFLRMSTVRPVRRIDTAGSQRASVEFVGSIRERPESPVSPTTSTSSGGSKLRNKLRNKSSKEDGVGGKGTGAGVSRKGQAGRDLVDEVVLPVVQRVSSETALFLLLLGGRWERRGPEGKGKEEGRSRPKLTRRFRFL